MSASADVVGSGPTQTAVLACGNVSRSSTCRTSKKMNRVAALELFLLLLGVAPAIIFVLGAMLFFRRGKKVSE